MTLTLDNRSQNKESSLTQVLRQIQELNCKIQELEQYYQDYVRSQQNLITVRSPKSVFLPSRKYRRFVF
jgi:uncharacterized protein (DUF3084 family)